MVSFSKMRSCRLAVLCLISPVLFGAQAFAQNTVGGDQAYFVTIQVPGSVSTNPAAVNTAGQMAGYYGNANDPYFAFHGFFRDAHGAFTTFDVPGSLSTQPSDINAEGTIVGIYRDAKSNHGFIRSARGVFTLFDVPNSIGDTNPSRINDAGTIIGAYHPPFVGQPSHGFVRDPSGVITLFDPVGSIQTNPRGLNDKGVIVGDYADANDMGHGFSRDPSGAITTLDAPGIQGTSPWSINTKGTIAGAYTGSGDIVGFVRSTDGVFSSFNPPPGTTGPEPSGFNTNFNINAAGFVVGQYLDTNHVNHGLLRSPDGALQTIDFPGSDNTYVESINDFGVVLGIYTSGSFSAGFMRVPSGEERFQTGTYDVVDEDDLHIDGGFYLYGDPTVRLWPYVAGNPSQHWHFGEVPGGFTMLNLGTGQYASDRHGKLFESDVQDVWTVTAIPGGYSIKNNRTRRFLTDPFVQRGTVRLRKSGSIWRLLLLR